MSPHRWTLVALLWVTYCLNYADRQVVFSLLPALRSELGFNDWQLGLIGTIFIWTYSLASAPAGRIADRVSRPKLIIASVVLWSVATLATGLSRSPVELLISRGLIGLTEALYFPAALSLLASVHGGDTRSRAIALHGSAQFAGIAFGGWFGGWMTEAAGWRAPFFVLAAAGLLWSPLLALALSRRAPRPAPRSASSPVDAGSPGVPVCFAALAAAFFCLCALLWMLYAWLPLYLYERHGLGLASAGLNATLYLQAGSACGILLGGVLGDRASNNPRTGRFSVAGFGLLLAAPLAFFILAADVLPIALLASAVFGLFAGVMMANTVASAYDVTPGARHGAAAGWLTLIGGLAGGLAILFAGILKESVGMVFLMRWCASFTAAAALILVIAARLRYARERIAVLALLIAVVAAAQSPLSNVELRRRYLDLTHGWAREAVFTRAEAEAMEKGKQYEDAMYHSLDDVLARKTLAAGEPSWESLTQWYPGKILDRAVLGTYSDPSRPLGKYENEFTYWWNGAISANLLPGLVPPAGLPAANTNVLFRVGSSAEMFGRDGERFSRIGYERGYLPVMTATYRHEDLTYVQTAFAGQPRGESDGWDIAFVRFDVRNNGTETRAAALHADILLVDGTPVTIDSTRVRDTTGAVLLRHAAPGGKFSSNGTRLSWTFRIPASGSAQVYFKIPYIPDKAGLVKDAAPASFDAALDNAHKFWQSILDKAARFDVPEERVNNVWRAILLQNLVLADGPRFTYGAGLLYNDSYYPHENGFGTQVFAEYGLTDYAAGLLPWAFRVSLTPESAGRKYQNRRAMPMHHLLENWRYTRSTAVFEQYRADLYRVAEEIIADRRSTMKLIDGQRPLHWGLLPPEKPGVDTRAATQTAYVVAHSISNCQGLQDLGEFLVRTGIDRERGERYREEARAFRDDLMTAMRRGAIRTKEGLPFIDLQTLYFRETPEFGPEPYDHLALGRVQGTYLAYWVQMQYQYNFFTPREVMGKADKDAGEWLADFVENRGAFVLGCTRARLRDEKVRYGWVNNVYNQGIYEYRLRGGDVDRFLLGFYSRLGYGMTRHAYISSEGSPLIYYNTRNGGFAAPEHSFPNSAAHAETLKLLRLMLVYEELRDNVETGTIWLARGAPRSWFGAGKRIAVTSAPTYFGPLSYRVDSAGTVIRAVISPPRRDPYRQIALSLRHPERRPLRKVMVNGAEHRDFDESGVVRLASGPGEFRVEARFGE